MFTLLLWGIPPAKCFTHQHGLCTAEQAGSQSSPLFIFLEQEAARCPPGSVIVHATVAHREESLWDGWTLSSAFW